MQPLALQFVEPVASEGATPMGYNPKKQCGIYPTPIIDIGTGTSIGTETGTGGHGDTDSDAEAD